LTYFPWYVSIFMLVMLLYFSKKKGFLLLLSKAGIMI
jgi:hypothetical protein